MSNPFPKSNFELFLLFMLVLGAGIIGVITYPFRKIKSLFSKQS